jgi:hypothetical protein
MLLLADLLSTAMTSSGRVSVKITTSLCIPPAEARAAWLDYGWAQGGGLPGVINLLSDDAQSRTLLPVLLKESLVPTERSEDVAYTVTDAGPVLSLDVVAGSHAATVRFEPSDTGGTEMVWDVGFDTSARRAFWELFTRTTVGEVSANIEASTRQPITFRLTATLAARSPGAALDAWLDCLADNDLGVPMPPPIVVSQGDASKEGWERLVVPPGLRERVVRVVRGDEGAAVEYTVVNPGWATCYPAHTHAGAVAFAPSADGRATEMTWTVAVRPRRGGAPLVRGLTSLIVPAFARNLAGRLGDAEAAGVSYQWT